MSRRDKSSRDKRSSPSADQPSRLPDGHDGHPATETAPLIRRHIRLGWGALVAFLLLGIVLETLHGFKIDWYMNVSNTTRRHLWTLAHAHGTLLAVLNLVFAGTVHLAPRWSDRHKALASACLCSASLLLPLGFLLGGIDTHGGDPGLGIILVPVGALLLLLAALLAARGYTRQPAD